MALRKHYSEIINLSFHISSEDGTTGVQLSQAIVNGQYTECGFRTINGARKSAEIKLDRAALVDLQTALTEILGEDSPKTTESGIVLK